MLIVYLNCLFIVKYHNKMSMFAILTISSGIPCLQNIDKSVQNCLRTVFTTKLFMPEFRVSCCKFYSPNIKSIFSRLPPYPTNQDNLSVHSFLP